MPVAIGAGWAGGTRPWPQFGVTEWVPDDCTGSSAFGMPWTRRAGPAQLAGRISPFSLPALSAALPWAAASQLRAANRSRLRWFCCIWLPTETFRSSLEPPVAVKSAGADPLKPCSPFAAELSCRCGQGLLRG